MSARTNKFHNYETTTRYTESQLQRQKARNAKVEAIVTAFKLGGCPIPCRGKKPILKRWTSLIKSWDGGIPTLVWTSTEFCSQLIERECNIGVVLTKHVHSLDFDSPDDYFAFILDHPEVATFPTVKTSGGYRPLFRPRRPMRKRKIDGGYTGPSYEILGLGSQAILPPGIHPDTGTPYTWEVPPNGPLPQFDLLDWRDIGQTPQSGNDEGHPLLTDEQQQKAEELLFSYLPGARRIGGEIGGYLNPNSKSRAHIKASTKKNVFIDWQTGKGGTIRELLRRLGIAIPTELGGMGDDKIPEFMPIWAIDRDWRENGWHCGGVRTVMRRDGVPFWTGRAFCLQWGCAECCIRLKNIKKARLRTLKNLTVFEAPACSPELLARIKRGNRYFAYARAINLDVEYIIVRDAGGEVYNQLITAGFEPSQLTPDDVVDGLPHANVGRRKKRFIASRNFWHVGINVLTPRSGCSKKEEQGGSMQEKNNKERESIYTNSDKDEGPEYDIVVLDDDYNEGLARLRRLGFGMQDIGEGESHRLMGNRAVEPDELGEVIDIIKIGRKGGREPPKP